MKTIYSMSKTGKTTQWSATLDNTPNIDGYIEITIKSGYTDGKKTESVRYVKSGKNLGRANETTIFEQAQLELERLYKAKYDKGYKDDINDVSLDKEVNNIPKPMLAHKYPNKVHKLPQTLSEIVMQPKVDGIRCLITKLDDDSIRFTSRTGKPFVGTPKIAEEASRLLSKGDFLDGELYVPGLDLQDIVSLVMPSKNIKQEGLDSVKLYWYDFIPAGKKDDSFKSRFIDCELEFKDPIVRLETSTFFEEEAKSIDVGSEDFETILEEKFEEYIEKGYEGLMLRDITTPYSFGIRHDSLQKYKKMLSEEFEIVDIVESENDEAPRFICDLRNDNNVTVRLKGDKEVNLEYLNNKSDYIGKWMTIDYQTKTKTGSLQFPVGVAIRDGSVVDGEFVPNI